MTKRSHLNLFEKLENSDYKLLRKRVVEAVLATDMMNHSKLVGIITSRLLVQYKEDDNLMSLSQMIEENKELNKFDVQQDYINFVIHGVDIGHAAKPFSLELKWAELVSQEFHNQGDSEKKLGLTISFLCDRATANLPASQVSFINGIVLPTFQLIQKLLPLTYVYVEMITKSKEEWEILKDAKADAVVN